MDAFLTLLVVIIIVCWACYRRKLSKAVYGIAALDMLLRIIYFVSTHIGVNAVASFFGSFPNSLLAVAGAYTEGIVYLIIAWAFVLLMIYFLVMTLSIFFKK